MSSKEGFDKEGSDKEDFDKDWFTEIDPGSDDKNLINNNLNKINSDNDNDNNLMDFSQNLFSINDNNSTQFFSEKKSICEPLKDESLNKNDPIISKNCDSQHDNNDNND